MEYTLHLHHETALAIRVSDTGEDKDAVWLPLSQVNVIKTSIKGDVTTVAVDVPDWLAEREGLA